MTLSQKTSSATRSDAERGALISALLAGAWRATPTAADLSETELTEIAPLLCHTGSAALGWWRIRDQRSEPAAMLHEAYRRFRLSALIHEQEIKYVFSLLRAEGIEPVLVKGWAIARLYPDQGLRPYGDIDLCVRPDQFAKAERVLKCLESIDGHYVDLHSGFAKLEGAHASLRAVRRHHCLRWDELFERSQLVSLCSPCPSGEFPAKTIHHEGTEDTEKIRVLSDEDHLRILCLHLLRSGAWRPLWLCDVAVALETRAADFNWDRCLGSDPKIADWIACTIGLAQRLLKAGSADVPSALSARQELPRWLAPAILRQWGRSLNPHALEMALPALSARTDDARKFFKEMYARWDQPVRATVAVRGRFNNWPRLPYQLGELLLRSSEIPKQLSEMFRGLIRNQQRRATEARSHRERNGTGRTNETTSEAREMLRPLPFVS